MDTAMQPDAERNRPPESKQDKGPGLWLSPTEQASNDRRLGIFGVHSLRWALARQALLGLGLASRLSV